MKLDGESRHQILYTQRLGEPKVETVVVIEANGMILGQHKKAVAIRAHGVNLLVYFLPGLFSSPGLLHYASLSGHPFFLHLPSVLAQAISR